MLSQVPVGWVLLTVVLTLAAILLVINLLGDWLRDVMNPKLYKD